MQMVADLSGVGWRILGMPVGAGAISFIGLSRPYWGFPRIAQFRPSGLTHAAGS